MKFVTLSLSLLLLAFISCNNSDGIAGQPGAENKKATATPGSAPTTLRHFRGAISNGMKGDSLFFDISADGKRLENLTFRGYWRCSGRLEQIIAGPEGNYVIIDGRVSDHISEPPDGGSTAWRFDLNAEVKSTQASGDFRMNINNLGCDTYKLKWTAVVF